MSNKPKKEVDVESYQNENYEESEMGQLHGIHLNMNAIQEVRNKLYSGTTYTHCMDCGAKIPKKRQKALPGVKLCVECQTWNETYLR